MTTVGEVSRKAEELYKLSLDLQKLANDIPVWTSKINLAADKLIEYANLLDSFKVLEPEDIE